MPRRKEFKRTVVTIEDDPDGLRVIDGRIQCTAVVSDIKIGVGPNKIDGGDPSKGEWVVLSNGAVRMST